MKDKKKSIFQRAGVYMGKKKWLLNLAIVTSVISAIINVVPYIFIWRVIREALNSNGNFEIPKVYSYFVVIGVASVLGIFVYFLVLLFSHLAAFRAECGMQEESIKKVFNKSLGYFDTVESGQVRKIINDGASSTHSFIAHRIPDMAGAFITPLAFLVMIVTINWRLGIVALIPLVLGFLTSVTMSGKKQKAFMKVYLKSLEDMSSESVEYVRGIPVVKAFGQTVRTFTSFYKSIVNYRDRVTAYSIGMTPAMAGFYTFLNASALFIVPFSVLYLTSDNAAVVLSDFIFYLLLTPVFGRIIMKSMYFNHDMILANAAIDKIEAIVDYPDLIYSDAKGACSKSDLEFKNVCFSYTEGAKDVIKNVSFKVNEGETVALVGMSGSGKTTLARLAARFWDVREGQILIGGVDIRELPKASLMNKISFVFQNTKLFSKSLRENILMGNENASDEDVQRALEDSCSREIIDMLPKGLDTVIGTKGTYLSGGEQQRISLARAIVKDAPILLLDEATAFTDPENEKLIQKALFEMGKNKTTLMIAHRLSSVVDVDRIILLEKGEIIGMGTHAELMKDNEKYRDMYNEYMTSINWNIKSVKGA